MLYHQSLLSSIHHAHQVRVLLAVETQTGSGCSVQSRTVQTRTTRWKRAISVHTWLTAALLGICRFWAGLFWTGRLSGLIPLNRVAFFLAAKPVMTPCPRRLATMEGSLRFRVKRLFTTPPTDGQNKTSCRKLSDMADLHTIKHWNYSKT